MSLPSGYRQVEYIQSSGTQYVNTGFKPNNSSRIVIDFEWLNTETGIFSLVQDGNSKFFGFQASVGKWYVYYGSTGAASTISCKLNTRYVADLNKNCLYVDESLVKEMNTANFSMSYPLVLCGYSSSGKVSSFASMKIYSCQTYDNGTLVRDFVPCINPSGVAGLYDLVNGVFYGNAGTGTFAAGPELYVDTPTNFEQLLAVYLRWSAVDCEGYHIYRDGVLLGTTTDTYYIDLTADENEQYTYTLTAFNGSAESDPATLEVYTRSGYFVLKPVIESAFFQ